MLLKFKDLKDKFAVGLRWAVETRQGLEEIQYNFDLNFGFTLPIKGADKHNKLKLIALADETHDKSIGLAGLLCREYENLIFVHRINETTYWLCVIKGGEIWMGMDVPRATAGDYVGDLETVNAIIEAAKEDFALATQYDPDASSKINVKAAESDEDSPEDVVDLSDVLLCSDTAWGDFQSFNNINFIELILKASKMKRAYIIRYLEPSKVMLQKVILIAVLVFGIGGAGYYFFHVQSVQEMLMQQKERDRLAKIRAEKAKANYFLSLKETIKTHWGHNVIAMIMYQFRYLPLQSDGWELSSAVYDADKPDQMALSLTRSSFGTANSFVKAYGEDSQGKMDKSRDSGSKTWTFSRRFLPTTFPPAYTNEQLTDNSSTQLYQLISVMQLIATDAAFKFTPGKTSVSRYKVTSTKFELAGNNLWGLKKAELMFARFPTLTVDSVELNVRNYDMSWKLKGTIYV